MIIEPDTTDVVTNISTENTKTMGISDSPEAVALMMTVLTNLYGDPKTAVVRETVANAIDSHIASGQTRKIEVTLPDRFTNMFVVEDFGVGMSHSDIDNIYTKYWESTKRKSKDQIGAYGLGAKSPLAIANQFTVRAIKDGVLVSVLIQKAVDGLNTVTVVAKMETDLPNGVKVSIPVDVDDRESFNEKAHEFFKYSEPSLLLVNGEEPESVYKSTSKVVDPNDPDFIGYVGGERGESVVVMGGVPYALTGTEMRNSMRRLGLSWTHSFIEMHKIFPVAIGDVDLTPNREGLRLTDRTQAVVDRLIGSLHAGLAVSAQAEIDAEDDRNTVYTLLKRWTTNLDLNSDDFTWRGEKIVKRLQFTDPVAMVTRSAWAKKNSHSVNYGLHLDRDSDVLVLVGRGTDKYRTAAQYINDYCSMNKLGYGEHNFLFIEEVAGALDTEWFTENSHFTFKDVEEFIAEVKAYRKSLLPPKEPKDPKDRVKIVYPVWDIENNTVVDTDAKDIPAGAFLVNAGETDFVTIFTRVFESGRSYSRMRSTERLEMAENLREFLPQVKHVVYLVASRKLEVLEKKAKQTFTSIYTLVDGLNAEAKALTEDPMVHLYRWAKDHEEGFWFSLAKQDGLLDPEITRLQAPAGQEDRAARLVKLLEVLRYFPNNLSRSLRYAHDEAPEWFNYNERSLREKYVLLSNGMYGYHSESSQIMEHAVHYVNAVYTSTLVNS